MAFTMFHLLRQLHLTGEYSDLEIRCDGYTAKVHKNIVCMQSEWFAKAVKEPRFMEGQTDIITLHDTTRKAVHAMCEYMYTHDYDLSNRKSETPSACQRLLDHLDIYALADMLQHTDLRATAKRKFNALLHSDLYPAEPKESHRGRTCRIDATPRGDLWPNPNEPFPSFEDTASWKTLFSPKECKALPADQGTIHTDPLFLDVVIKVFEVSPPNEDGDHLRTMVFDRMKPHVKLLFRKHEDFDAVIERMPELGKMVWDVLVENNEGLAKDGKTKDGERKEEPSTAGTRGTSKWEAGALNAYWLETG